MGLGTIEKISIAGSIGAGKCLGRDTPVLMYDGRFKRVQDVVVGDFAMGDDGTPRTVLTTTSGRDEMARISLTKGDSFTCNMSHVLSLKISMETKVRFRPDRNCWLAIWHEVDRDTDDGTVSTIKKKQAHFATRVLADAHIADKLQKDNVVAPDDTIDIAVKNLLDMKKVNTTVFKTMKAYHSGLLHFGKNGQVEKCHSEDAGDDQGPSPAKRARLEDPLQIAPYAVGHWLGDGSGGSNGATTITQDKEIVAYYEAYLPSIGLRLNKINSVSSDITYSIAQDISTRTKSGNKFTNFIVDEKLGFAGKRIIDVYKYGGEATRLRVLAGLLDADGNLDKNGFDLVLKSETLIKDAAFVARSLGFRVTECKDRIFTQHRTTTTYNGTEGEPLGCYKRIRIYGDTTRIPTILPHKKADSRTTNTEALREGITIEKLAVDDYFGFTLDGNHRFVVGEGMIVTHNSTLTQSLSKKLGFAVCEEPSDENEYLADFYDNKTAHAFACQVAFLASRFKQHSDVVTTLNPGDGVVMDRGPHEDVIFARMLHERGEIDDRDFRTYNKLFDTLVANIGADIPDVVIYLDVGVDELMHRVEKRGRECEQGGGVSREYLKQLGKQYDRFVEEMGRRTTVFRVDWNDFHDTDALWDAVVRECGTIGVKEIRL